MVHTPWKDTQGEKDRWRVWADAGDQLAIWVHGDGGEEETDEGGSLVRPWRSSDQAATKGHVWVSGPTVARVCADTQRFCCCLS